MIHPSSRQRACRFSPTTSCSKAPFGLRSRRGSALPRIIREGRCHAAPPDIDDVDRADLDGAELAELARVKLQKLVYKAPAYPLPANGSLVSAPLRSRSPERELKHRIQQKRLETLHKKASAPDIDPPVPHLPPTASPSETASFLEAAARTGASSEASTSSRTETIEKAEAHSEEDLGVGGVPKSVLIISCVSAALTMSSCVFNTLLPIYMVSELKMSMHSMGVFEGLMEAFSYIVRMFSGVISDMMTSRKAAITVGFAMGASAKFGMSSASTVAHLFTAKAIDRLANGVQAAPRDALISDLAPDTSRSSCFGFAQSLRKWGSAVGASAVFFLMKATNNNYQLIFMMAAGISALSTLAFVAMVPNHKRPMSEEEKGRSAAKARGEEVKGSGFLMSKLLKDVVSMGGNFYRMLAVIAAYTMCHINESMLEARAMEVGFGKAEASLVVAVLAGAIFLMAYPLGRLDDKYGPRTTFAVGVAALFLGNLTLLLAPQFPHAVFVSLFFLGAHWAIVQGPMLGIVAGYAPPHLRGTAFGIFYTMMAITAISSNTLFGAIWTAFSAQHAFMLSGAMALLLLLALPSALPPDERGEKAALVAA